MFYQAVGLPFGWAPAPAIFTKLARQVLTAVRYPQKITWPAHVILRDEMVEIGQSFVTAYLDDILAIGSTFAATALLV